MKKLFFITPLLYVVITTISCSNNAGQTQTATEATQPEEQSKTVVQDVDVTVFAELIATKKGQILDVRTPEEWQEGTIKEAIKINFFDDNFAEQIQKLDKNEPVYVYCKSGNRSGKAAKQMEELGFTKIYNLEGGFGAWRSAEKEIVK